MFDLLGLLCLFGGCIERPIQYVNNNQIIAVFRDKCPSLSYTNIHIADPTYITPTLDELKDLVDSYSVRIYVPELCDCDDHALMLHAHIIRERYKQWTRGKLKSETTKPWAFGQIWYLDNYGTHTHAVNVCITESGLYMIEPQTREIKPFKKIYRIDMIRM